MRVELHCHSRRSDGTESPAEVARKAAAAGVRLFCLTDHDTWAGHAEVAAAATGMTVLRGLELSAAVGPRTAHLLVYAPAEGPALDALAVRLEEMNRLRRARVHEICARFLRWNIRLDPEAVLAAAGAAATAGRPHVAAELVRAGVCRTPREAFERFLRDGGPADVPAPRLEVDEAVPLAASTGARVALAHPHTVGAPATVEAVCARLRPLGLGGLEAEYGPYVPRVRAVWRGLAETRGLVVTAGSDYHGPGGTPAVAAPGMTLPDEDARRLTAWLGGA